MRSILLTILLLVLAAPGLLGQLQSIKVGLIVPLPVEGASGAPTYSVGLLDAAAEKRGFVVRAPKTGTIDQIGWRTGTVTTGATLDVRLETVDGSGFPSGTLFGATTNGAQVVADANDNTWFNTALTAGAVVAKGDLLGVSIVNPGTPGNLEIVAAGAQDNNFPYSLLFTASWAKTAKTPCLALRYSDVTYEPLFTVPASALGDNTVASNTTPDEYALKFQIPFPARLTGVWVHADLDGDTTLTVYDSDGSTVLSDVVLDLDVRQTTSGYLHYIYLDNTVTLTANTYYRVSLVPTTTTAIRVFNMSVQAAAILDGMSGGQLFHQSTRTDAGSWTDTTTARPFFGVILDQFHNGAGSGGWVIIASNNGDPIKRFASLGASHK